MAPPLSLNLKGKGAGLWASRGTTCDFRGALRAPRRRVLLQRRHGTGPTERWCCEIDVRSPLARLRLVHCCVSVADHVLGSFVAAGASGDTDGCAHRDLLAFDVVTGRQFRLEALGDRPDMVHAVHVVEQYGKLVPAEANGCVVVPQVSSYSFGHPHQELVPKCVPVTVVYGLEAVQVHEQDAELVIG